MLPIRILFYLCSCLSGISQAEILSESKNFPITNSRIDLTMSAPTQASDKTTLIYYVSSGSTGLDPGYDAGAYIAGIPSFGLYTYLVNNNQDILFQVQALSDENYENAAVPLSVYAPLNTQLTFSATTISLPDVKVFIEDRFNRTVHEVGDGNTFQITVTEAMTGEEGRFYMHTCKVAWLGTTNTDWNTASNWSSNTVPGSTDDFLIMNVLNRPVFDGNLTVNNMSIASGAGVTIKSDLIINGTLTINSDVQSSASLIVQGNTTGNIIYDRYVTYNASGSSGWHLIGAPIVGETIEDIISNGSLADGSSGNRKGMAIYNNNVNHEDFGNWEYYTSSTTGTIPSAKGYAVKRNVAGRIPCEGSLLTDNLSYSIAQGTETIWSLIANPYPSFLKINGDDDSFLEINQNVFDPSTLALYYWDSKSNNGNGEYVIVNLASSDSYIAPGQAFFVASNTTGGMIRFNENMQVHEPSTNVFARNTIQKPQITVKLTHGENTKSTNIIYLDSPNATIGLDKGYDARLFDETSDEYTIFSQLVSENEGVNLMLQALPVDFSEGMSIPLGIRTTSEIKATFSLSTQNISEDSSIFLEDRKLHTFTKLNVDDADYSTILHPEYNGIGRFYLHVDHQSGSDSDFFDGEGITIYKTSNSSLRVSGLQRGPAQLTLFNMLGVQVLQTDFIANGIDNVHLSTTLEAGVYIVNIKTNQIKLNKKISIY